MAHNNDNHSRDIVLCRCFTLEQKPGMLQLGLQQSVRTHRKKKMK